MVEFDSPLGLIDSEPLEWKRIRPRGGLFGQMGQDLDATFEFSGNVGGHDIGDDVVEFEGCFPNIPLPPFDLVSYETDIGQILSGVKDSFSDSFDEV